LSSVISVGVNKKPVQLAAERVLEVEAALAAFVKRPQAAGNPPDQIGAMAQS
jgi:hypothetical protein